MQGFLPLWAAKPAVAVVATGLRPRETPAESASLSTSLSASLTAQAVKNLHCRFN